jgi:surface protein
MASEKGLHVADLLGAPGLTSTLRERLQAADADGDGFISASEMMDVMQREITATRDRKMMVRVLAALSVACVLIIAAVVGLTYAVVEMSKDTSVENNVLVGKDGLQPLSTATLQQTTPLRDLYQASGPSELQGLTHLTVPFGNGTGIFRIQDVFLVPGQRVRFDTAAEGVSVEVTAEGVTVSGDEQAPGGRRRLMETFDGDSGSATGSVVLDSTTTESDTTGSSPLGDSPTGDSPTGDSPTGDSPPGDSQAVSGADGSGTPIPASEPASAADLVTTGNKFYLAPNGITVLCPDADLGDTGVIGGVTYTKVNEATLKSLAKNSSPQLTTSCTTGITSMSYLFQGNKKFNVDISSWDVRKVTNMASMFYVRAPPSRVSLLLRRCVVVVARSLYPRSEIAAHSTRPHAPRCAVVCQCLQSAHR